MEEGRGGFHYTPFYMPRDKFYRGRKVTVKASFKLKLKFSLFFITFTCKAS